LRHAVVDRWSRGASSLHRFDPRAKVVSLLVLLAALATSNRNASLFACALLLMLIAALAWARVPVGGALARAAVVLPFGATFAAISWLGGEQARGVSLALKSYVSALAVLLVVSTTPLPALLGGFETLGAPRFLLEVAQFLYRYLFLLSEEVQIMRKAAAARSASLRRWPDFFRSGGERFRASAGALAVLFARSYVRAEAIHHAMLARGFQGRLPVLAASRFRPADAAVFAISATAPWVLRNVVERIRL
jgi:cobalt/nickel transport system permease protein